MKGTGQGRKGKNKRVCRGKEQEEGGLGRKGKLKGRVKELGRKGEV